MSVNLSLPWPDMFLKALTIALMAAALLPESDLVGSGALQPGQGVPAVPGQAGEVHCAVDRRLLVRLPAGLQQGALQVKNSKI